MRGEAGSTAPLDPSAFATVIRADDFADRVTTVPELLREAVGVQVQSLGGDFATVSIRGSTAEQVMVYLDGVPLNRALGGSVNIADLPLGQIESIAIYRGFTPASLPASSIGGAILIETRHPDGKNAASASASYGSFGTGEGIASWSGGSDRAAWSLGADSKASRGDFSYVDNNGTEFSSTDEFITRRANNDFRRDHLAGRLSLKTGERARLAVSTDLLSSDQGVPGLGAAKSAVARFGSSRSLFRTEIEVPGLLGGRLLARGAADYTLYR
ncbi:MAG TPA: TonB-dependent receptor plug domain-containing protein, partial [Candidatus Polarisedimenticolia bacterium]|nr:TonB-dependent receptor plug domain-containing protein [Candidatus Polarisedimenticolia bacterium]